MEWPAHPPLGRGWGCVTSDLEVSSNSETIGIFYDFLGDKSSMTSGTRFL